MGNRTVLHSAEDLARRRAEKGDLYLRVVEPRLGEIREIAEDGGTVQEIAKHLGIAASTLHSYRKKHPELAEILDLGMAVADDFVENALFQRAVGMKVVEETIVESGKSEVDSVRRVTKELPPDVGACSMWLKNRRPESWKDAQELDIKTPKTLAALVQLTAPTEPQPELPEGDRKQLPNEPLMVTGSLENKSDPDEEAEDQEDSEEIPTHSEYMESDGSHDVLYPIKGEDRCAEDIPGTYIDAQGNRRLNPSDGIYK